MFARVRDSIRLRRYRRMRNRGATPEEIARAAADSGLSKIEQIRVLRLVLGVGLLEAKEAVAKAEGFDSLSEQQEALVPALEQFFAQEASEGREPDDPEPDRTRGAESQ